MFQRVPPLANRAIASCAGSSGQIVYWVRPCEIHHRVAIVASDAMTPAISHGRLNRRTRPMLAAGDTTRPAATGTGPYALTTIQTAARWAPAAARVQRCQTSW